MCLGNMVDERKFFDEMHGFGDGVRKPYEDYNNILTGIDTARLKSKAQKAEDFFRRTGITFNV